MSLWNEQRHRCFAWKGGICFAPPHRTVRLSGAARVTFGGMLRVRDTSLRACWFALLLVVALTVAGPAGDAGAGKFPPSGLRFFADVGVSPPPSRSLITVENVRGSLRALSIRGVRDVRAAVPAGSPGKTVGYLNISPLNTSSQPGKRLKLVMPRQTSARKLVLTRDGQLVVVLHPARASSSSGGGAPNLMLSIRGLPAGTATAYLTFDGAGRGILTTTRGCPVRPTLSLYVLRAGAAPATATSYVGC